MVWFYVLLLVIILVFYHWLSCSPFRFFGSGIKWYLPLPLVGNTVSSLFEPYGDFWLRFYLSERHVPMVGFHLFKRPALLIMDPELIKQVMITDYDSFSSRGMLSNPKDPFGRSVLMTAGETSKAIRSKITPFFSPSRIKEMFVIIRSNVNVFVDHLKQSIQDKIDIDDESIRLSTDVIVSTTFGLQPDSFRNKDSFFFGFQKELLGFETGLKLLLGILSPWLYLLLDCMMLSKSTTNGLFHFVKQIINERLEGKGVRTDFIQGMVELYLKDAGQEVKTGLEDGVQELENSLNDTDERNETDVQSEVMNSNSVKFDMDTITGQCMVMFIAGTDTTGHTIGFLLYELTMNPLIQKRLRNEIQEIRSENGIITYEGIGKMNYLDMVVSGILRKYPAGPIIIRTCTRDTTIGDLEVRKDTMLVVSIIGLHMDEKYFPHPYHFDPERFRMRTNDQGFYIPFGIGPRACIGQRLALIEIKLAVCEVLTHFELLPCRETPKRIDFGFGATLNPRNGIKLIVKPLK